MPSIAEHLNWHVKQWWHARRARGVLATPPIVPRDDGVVIFSMIGTRVLLPYLVAVKSFHAALGRGRIAILDDGTLTDEDRATLAHHLGNPEIRHISTIDTGPCPKGSVWERLFMLLDLRRHDYVIQLDSDTVTVGAVPEIAAAIAAGRDFTLLGEADATLVDAAAFARAQPPCDPRSPAVHVQQASEAVLDRIAIPGVSAPRYVRGCAGFAGFAPSSDGSALTEAFSQEMDRLIGRPAWARWGSEQVASNFAIANSADPLLLPYARYLNFWNERIAHDAAFVHFIGTYRFHGNAYLTATDEAIAALRGGWGQAPVSRAA